MQFLDPTNDYAFKKILGDERKKRILMSFLNSILGREGEDTITDVTYLNPSQVPHIKGAKETLLDVRCHDQNGTEYVVKIQVIYNKLFDQRVQDYALKSYSNQLNENDAYGALDPIILLGVINFSFTENGHCVSTLRVYDVETQEHLFKDFQFTLIELPKFNKGEGDLASVADKWIYFLKNAGDLAAVPAVIQEEALKEAFEVVNRINWTKEETDLYESRVKAWRDRAAEIEGGFDRGLERGREQARKEVREKAIQKGREAARRFVARNMLYEGFELETVSRLTDLSPKQLESL